MTERKRSGDLSTINRGERGSRSYRGPHSRRNSVGQNSARYNDDGGRRTEAREIDEQNRKPKQLESGHSEAYKD
jgi:hypothetical protein